MGIDLTRPVRWLAGRRHNAFMTQSHSAVAAAARHPADPEPVPSTKAAAAYALSLVALLTAPFVGGVIPAVMALRMSGQADADIAASDGFLLGAARSRRAAKLARISLGITGTVLLLLVVWLVFKLAIAGPQPQDVDPNVN